MVINYFGGAYFKVSLGDLTIAINPPAKGSNRFPKPARFGADIALVSTRHPDYSGVETVALGNAEPFVVDGPGSYEIKSIYISGAQSNATLEKKEYINTIYGFELDGIKMAIFGALSDESTLSSEAKEILSGADILFVPIGGGDVLDPVQAYKTAIAYDPCIIIPYDYDTTTLNKFLKEGGQEKNEIQDKATLKRKDLEGKEGFILVLHAQE